MRTLAAAALLAVTLAGCKKEAPPAAVPPPPAVDLARSLAAIVASCATAEGEVQVRRGGAGEWQPVATGALFRAGDVVRTGADAFARVEFVAGGALELEESAEVTIDLTAPAAGGAAERRIAVEKGVVRGFMPAETGAAPLVLRTADGQDVRLTAAPGAKPAAVRLTRGERGTEVAVVAGAVRIAGGGAEAALAAGQATDLTGAGAGAIVELVPFPPSLEPGIDARFRFRGELAIRLAWKPVLGAARYRVQIARDLAFQSIERTVDVDVTSFSFEPSQQGMYAWRVASRDASGRLGEYGFARRIYCEKEEPKDLLVGPPDGEVVKYSEQPPTIEFTWQSAESAAAYRVVLATGPDLLSQRALELETGGQRLEIPAPAPGTYYWGVYVKDLRAPVPIFVRPRQLVIQKLAKPKVTVPRAVNQWGK